MTTSNITAALPYQLVDRSRLVPSPLNPRKYFDEARLAELAASMGNGVGILEPILARSNGAHDNAHLEIVAGERRWRAAAIAGLDLVPVIVKELTDAQVIERMLIENGQREDVNPLEEGEGFKVALKLGTFADVGALAAHVGKSTRYVYDHLKLVDDLVPEAKALLARGELTGSHGVILSRLTPQQQEEALDPDAGGVFEDDDDAEMDAGIVASKPRSVRQLEEWVQRRYRLDPASRQTRELFPETARAIEDAAKVVQITHHTHIDYGVDREEAKGVLIATAWRRADGLKDSERCDHSVLGVVVLGPGRGQAFQVCTAKKKCAQHWPGHQSSPSSSGSSKSAGAGAKPGDELVYAKTGRQVKRSQLETENKRHDDEVARREQLKVDFKKALPAILKAAAAKVLTLPPERLASLVTEESTLLREAYALLKPKKRDAAAVLAALGLAAVLGEAQDPWYAPGRFPAYAKERLGLDVAPLLKAVQTPAQPVAKSASKPKPKVKVVAKKKATPKATAKKSAKKKAA